MSGLYICGAARAAGGASHSSTQPSGGHDLRGPAERLAPIRSHRAGVRPQVEVKQSVCVSSKAILTF